MFSHTVTPTNLNERRVLVITLAISALLLTTLPSQAKGIVIYNQSSSTAGPAGDLIADSNGTLYGIADGGGAYGSVYSLTPPATGQTAWTETVLYSFQG
jgi:hypothetical protein